MSLLRCAMVAWAVCAVWTTDDRAQLWADEPGLWADAVAQAPAKPRPLMNLAKQYVIDGDVAAADAAYRQAMALASATGRSQDERIHGVGLAATNLALLRCRAGDRLGALAITTAALKHRPVSTTLAEVHSWLELQRLSCS